MKFQNRCVSKDDYEFTCRQWVKKHNADKACVDAARFFWPCKEIVSVNYIGKLVEVLDSKDYSEKKRKKEAERFKKMSRMYPDKSIPMHIQNKLKFGTFNRTHACYGIGADLTTLGFSKDEIISLVKKSAIISDGFNLDEAISAIRNGIKKAGQS